MPLPIARRQVELAKRRVPMLLYQEIKGNHFFLLSNEKTMAHAARWVCICDNIFWSLPYNTCIHSDPWRLIRTPYWETAKRGY